MSTHIENPRARKSTVDIRPAMKAFITVFCILATSFVVLSQVRIDSQVTPPSVAVGSLSVSPSIGDYGSISGFNGRLSYSMPLLKVGGRGDAGYPISIDLNRVWVFEYYYDEYMDMEGGNYIFTRYTLPSSSRWWGQTLKFMPGRLVPRYRAHVATHCAQPGEDEWVESNLTFVKQDGSEITLFPKTYPAGGNLQCTSYGSSGGTYAYQSVGTEFITVDGSGIKFVADQNSQLGGSPLPNGNLLFPNGTRYRIEDGFVLWIEDRNGNRTTFTYAIHPITGHRTDLTQITDSNGRVVTFTSYSDAQGIHDSINYQGFNGANKSVIVTYRALANALRAGETLKNQTQLFGNLECQNDQHNCPPTDLINPTVIASITFPENRKFEYEYNSYGELARVETPNGVAFEYDWGGALEGGSANGVIEYGSPYPDLFRQVVEKRVYPNGGSGNTFEARTVVHKSAAWNYSSTSSRKISVYDALGTRIGSTVTKFYGHPLEAASKPNESSTWSGFPDPLAGKDFETLSYESDDLTLVNRQLKEWTVASIATSAGTPWSVGADARVTKQISVSTEGSLALVGLQEVEYDGSGLTTSDYTVHLNPKRSKSYNIKTIAASTAESSTLQSLSALFTSSDLVGLVEHDYSSDQNYKDRNIIGLATETRVLNPTNPTEILAKSQAIHDESSYLENSYTATNWVDPQTAYRGNLTTTRTWNKDTSTWIESHTMFDNFGNVRKVWDTSGDPTRFVETEYSSTYNYAYPTKTKAPAPDPTGVHGTTQGSEINRTYDFNTGLLLSVTDDRGQTATTEYDALLRPIRINPPTGGSISETVYNDTPGNIWVKRRQQIDDVNWAESTTYFDNLGRAFKSRTKDLQGDVMSQVLFDSFGRVEKTSNPYRVDSSGNPTETVYWSKVRYDDRNRVVETYAPAPSGQTGNSLGTVEFGISDLTNLVGTYVVATDPSGRKSRAVSGIYGLMRVDEATGIGGTVDQDLGTLANPNQPTSYSYNIKGELTKITQGSQNRYFMYDSFGRLIRVRQPEQTPNSNLATTGNPDNNSWTAAYSYDIFGNVISMTDAKNTTITNHYDMASRPIRRIYSDGTPQVDFFYDGKGLPSTPQFSKGALTKATSTVSEDRFTEFDNHGRLLASQQITDGRTYPFKYAYNFSGGLIEQQYPSGRIVRNFLDADGGLRSVVTKTATDLSNKIVASNFDYSATGAVKKMKLGNGLWETAQIDHLGQLTQVGLGTTATNNDLFKVDYEYGELQTNGTVDATKNIGNIAKTTTTIPTTSFVQTFKYDAINRLTEAKETTEAATNWIQTFGYDRFGNRTSFSETIGGVSTQNTAINHPTIDAANNRFTTGQGYIYDFNGNIVQDAEGRSFTFNGDDKQTEVRNTSTNAIIGQYFYDGSGARVKKVVPGGETTIFVYDAGGALAAEYSTETNPEPTTSYLTTDHLGSPRVITDKTGNVIARRDFMPFGEELGEGVGPRTTNLKYAITGSDNLRKRFTGYEKDDETGLDFAEARMYQNKHGRFTAPDPLLASASATNPQTFNRYIYTGNNPVNYADPAGLSWCRSSTGRTTFTGEDKPCPENTDEEKWTNIDGEAVTLTAGDWSDVGGNVGDYGTLNRNGSFTPLVPASQQADLAPEKAVQVQAEAEMVATGDATSITDHLLSAGITVIENNGGNLLAGAFNLNPYNEHTSFGQTVGNVITLTQGAAEIGQGLALFTIGGAGTVATSPLCLTGVGCVAPAATASVSATGIVEALHGAGVITNTIYNMVNNQGPASRGGNLRNGHLASKVHPKTGVPFDADGFPDFSGHLFKGGKNDVIIKPTGRRDLDAAAANKLANYKTTPEGFVWHHHQDTGRMQLVDAKVHAATGHTGGNVLW